MTPSRVLAITLMAQLSHQDGSGPEPPQSRMQPLGIIVFSCIMGTLGFQILIEGVRQLVGPDHTHHLEDIYGVIGVMCTVVLVKFGLYLYCRESSSPAVQSAHTFPVITPLGN